MDRPQEYPEIYTNMIEDDGMDMQDPPLERFADWIADTARERPKTFWTGFIFLAVAVIVPLWMLAGLIPINT